MATTGVAAACVRKWDTHTPERRSLILLAQAARSNTSGLLSNLLFFAVVGGAMYMLIIRPQKKRALRIAASQAALEPGRQVVLSSGIYGVVSLVDTDSISLEIAPGVTVKVAKAAVSQVVELPSAAADPADPAPPLT